ncbi:hypothetical protein BJX70DRAFT_378976 [Aspergillus crustosus]
MISQQLSWVATSLLTSNLAHPGSPACTPKMPRQRPKVGNHREYFPCTSPSPSPWNGRGKQGLTIIIVVDPKRDPQFPSKDLVVRNPHRCFNLQRSTTPHCLDEEKEEH